MTAQNPKSHSRISQDCALWKHFISVMSNVTEESPVSKMKVIQLYDFRWKNERNYQVRGPDIAEKRRKKI